MKPSAPTYQPKSRLERSAPKGIVQARMKVSEPGDALEQEADAMAAKVMQKKKEEKEPETGVIARSIQRKPLPKEQEEEDQPLMRKAQGGEGVQVSPGMAGTLGQSQAGGEPLPGSAKTFMEDAFRRDFSGVRVHTGEKAGRMNGEINARAFTYGNDIYFNRGEFAPDTPEGKHLLAHELTHVVQQGRADTIPAVSRAVELRPPGKGEASAFGRVGELINRLNRQSRAMQYRLDGQTLRYDVKDPQALTSFDIKMQAFIDQGAVIPLKLITKEGIVDGQPLWVDSFREAYLDLDDMLASSDLSFQMNLIHLLAERFNVRDYAKMVGMRELDTRFFKASHQKGFEAEASHLQGVIGDPTISFLYEEAKPNGVDVFAFRSREGYRIFHVFPRDLKGIRGGSLFVLTKDGRRLTVDALIAERRKAATPATPIMPKLQVILPGTVMRKTKNGEGSNAGDAFAAKLSAARGGGIALPPGPRRFMEASFGGELGEVRIHTDETAAEISEEIGALAFTYGNDIFFNKGQFCPDSIQGAGLLAHELTHVWQRTGRDILWRAAKPPKPAGTQPVKSNKKFVLKAGGYTLDIAGATLEIPGLSMPTFKDRNKEKIKAPVHSLTTKAFDPVAEQAALAGKKPRKGPRIATRQVDNWKERVRSSVTASVSAFLSKSEKSKEGFYFLTTRKKGSQLRIIGTTDTIVDSCLIPDWGRTGDPATHQVDHVEELQLGGADVASNYELLDASANASSGGLILNERKRRAKKAIEEFKKTIAKKSFPTLGTDLISGDVPSAADIPTEGQLLANYVTVFNAIDDWKLGNANSKTKRGESIYWTLTEILDGKHLLQLRAMTVKEIEALAGTDKQLSILLRPSSIVPPKRIDKALNESNPPDEKFIKGFSVKSVNYNPDAKAGENIANLKIEPFPDQVKKGYLTAGEETIPVTKIPGVLFFGVIRGNIRDYFKKDRKFPPLSPINIENIDIDTETATAYMGGKILPEISFLDKLDLNVLFEGDDLVVSKTFSSDTLGDKMPSLFKLTYGELTVFASMKDGFGASGELGFEVARLGKGTLRGRVVQSGDFSLGFEFEFDKGLFDQSSISGGYETPEGKDKPEFWLKGFAAKTTKDSKIFNSARVDVSYIDGIFTASGEAETKLPGVDKGMIQVVTGKGETSVVADFVFNDKIPGVKSGNLHFLFQRKEDGSYFIDASALVMTKFSGIPTVALYGYYDSDGVFLFKGDAIISLPKFNGKVNFGITNQEVDQEGKLTGKQGKELVPFGSGTVNFKMTDWLSGNIGVMVTPDARTVLNGSLVPDPHLKIVDLMPPVEKKFGDWSLPRFTLFGIPHIAEIFVEVSGGFYFNASVGPMFLNNAILSFDQLEIEAPEKTIVQGSGQLDIPASAEIGVSGTIKAGGEILVVKATVGLTGSIGLAVRGNAGLAFAFEWSTAGGFKGKQATAYLKATTELVGRLSGDLDVDLDLLLTTVNLYHKHLGDKEKRWPLGLEIEANFPLIFNPGSEGGFKAPGKDDFKHPEPNINQETAKKAAIEDPPVPELAPSREEALERVRYLDPDATEDANWLSEIWERYNYIKRLKRKHPGLNWDFLDQEAKQLDLRDFDRLKTILLNPDGFPRSSWGRTLRLTALAQFEEERKYVNYGQAAELRRQVEQMTADED